MLLNFSFTNPILLTMEAAEDLPVIDIDAKTIKYHNSKRNELVPPIPLTISHLDRQMPPIANEQYEPGLFYEINHEKLPPKSPIQLKAIRVVMVSKTTTLDVTVSFPSTLSLRSYFTSNNQTAKCMPDLDEKFVMSMNQARRILSRRKKPENLEAETRLKSFWLTSPTSLQLESDGNELVGWGMRKKTTRKTTKRRKVEILRGCKERWSRERYDAAAKRLLEIMREEKAEIWTPVLRKTLRDEARKRIGDTGLLDHLLKHMAGEVVCDGKERFRRRHNSDGKMEYWLEPADLVEIRRFAGVDDSFWVPPPGWKVGDSLFPDCEFGIADLKQQVAAVFTRYDEQHNLLMKLENESLEMKEESEKVIGSWQEKCQILLEQIMKQEKELVGLFNCKQGIKEEMMLLKEKKKKSRLNEGGGGFRICKPPGTFLWPSTVTTPGLVNSLSPAASFGRGSDNI